MYGRYSLRLFVYILWAPLTANGIRGWLLFLKVIAYWEFFTSHLLGLVCGSGETDRWWLFLLLKATWIGLTLHRLIRGDRSALSSIYRRRRWPFCTWTILKIRLLYLDLEYRARIPGNSPHLMPAWGFCRQGCSWIDPRARISSAPVRTIHPPIQTSSKACASLTTSAAACPVHSQPCAEQVSLDLKSLCKYALNPVWISFK